MRYFTGWMFGDWPWFYSQETGGWYWADSSHTQYVRRMDTGIWSNLSENHASVQGWTFWQWPYFYSYLVGSWHWVNVSDALWIVNMSTNKWSVLGETERTSLGMQAKKSSNWRNNAKTRMMNILSPKMSDGEFRSRVAWAKSVGCDTIHAFVANQGNGEYAGYCIYGSSWSWNIDRPTTDLFRARINHIVYEQGMHFVPWLHSDDSNSWNQASAQNPDKYVKDLKGEDLLAHSSQVCLGLELEEYYNAAKVRAIASPTRKHYSGLVGTHEGDRSMIFAGIGNLVFYQVTGENAAWIKSETIRVKAAIGGLPLNMFELDWDPNKPLCEAAFQGGADFVGNWEN